jgi:2-polyprenyl-3-methyl-5-hydroxy-6-metoxy-1,4-benzoquinol methylase
MAPYQVKNRVFRKSKAKFRLSLWDAPGRSPRKHCSDSRENHPMLEFRHQLPQISLLPDRVSWMLQQCAGRRVVDIGCVDTGFLEERASSGELMHQRIAGVAKAILGVDIDLQGIERFRQLGFANVIAADLSVSSETVMRETERLMKGCDVIACGEVLEHVPNAGNLLNGIGELARAFDAAAIITVPNAFSIRSILAVLAGTEIVHPDHKYYFSWRTLKSLLEQSGLVIVETHFYADNRDSASRTDFFKAVLNRTLVPLRPQLGEGIAIKARAAGGRE